MKQSARRKLKKTEGFSDSEEEGKAQAETPEPSQTPSESLDSFSSSSNGKKKASRIRRRKPQITEEREYKYVLTHPPWYASLDDRSASYEAHRSLAMLVQELSVEGDGSCIPAALRYGDVEVLEEEG